MPLLQVQGMTKRFPGVLALDGVDFSMEAGEIRALLGENGAGKSTVIKLLTGVERIDEGTVRLAGEVIQPRNPAHAQLLGISTVYQEVNLVPNLTVAENIGLRDGGPIIRWRELRKRARHALDRLDLKVDVDRPLGDLPLAIQQLVAIARAIDREAKVLILDEPTSSLDRQEADNLFATMRRLRDEGMGIVFVTHFLDQVYAVSDSITILRNGKKVGDWSAPDLSHHDLIRHMIGQSLEAIDLTGEGTVATGEAVIQAKGLGKKKLLDPIDLNLSRGEVLGLSGLLGSGRTETLNLLYGVTPADSGSLNGLKPPTAPAQSVRKGWGLCPEDRKVDGIFPGLSIRENIAVVMQARRGWFRRIPSAKLDTLCEEMIKALNIRTPNAEKAIEQLSGGNQQKTILARWLASRPECLFLDEPTRGIDVGAKLEVRKLVRKLAGEGMAFVFTSSELEEVAGTCDRVLILRDRRKVGELAGPEISEDAIMDRISEAHA